MLEGRHCLFGSASAAGILFWASPKGALDLIASRPRFSPLNLRPPGPAWRTPRFPGNSLKRALRFSAAPLRSARSLRSLAPLPPESARNLPARRCEGEPLPLPLALPCPLRPKAVAPLQHPPLISFAPPPARAPLSSVLHLWPFCREKMDGDFFSISPPLSGIAIHFLASSCPADVGQRGSPCRR